MDAKNYKIKTETSTINNYLNSNIMVPISDQMFFNTF